MNPLLRRRAKNTWIRRFCRLSGLVSRNVLASMWDLSGPMSQLESNLDSAGGLTRE
jgi:hypothetical protein